MNKNILIGIVVVVVIILGFAIYSSDSPAAEVTQDVQTTPDKTEATINTPIQNIAKAKASFKSIFSQTGSHVCTFEQVNQGVPTESVIYIADGKMRGEFRTRAGTNSVSDMMVYSGGTLYVWKEGMATGRKTTVNSIADLPAVIPADLTSAAVFGSGANSVNWECRDWNKNATLLAPPKTVTFY